MVTNAEEPEKGPTLAERAADAAYSAKDTAVEAVRYVVSGDPRGRIRRGMLYLVVTVGVTLGLPLVALPAILLLALTDNVIEEA